jgi:hypothetical protein
MKQIAVFFKVVLLIAVLASFAACQGGTFVDPGSGGGGGGGSNDIPGFDDLFPDGFDPNDYLPDGYYNYSSELSE